MQTTTSVTYHGVLTLNKSFLCLDDILSNPTGEAYAVFSLSPLVYNNVVGSTSVYAGEILLNDHLVMKYNAGGTQFYETGFAKFPDPPYTWEVSGSEIVPYFEHTLPEDFPEYNGYVSLPDSIDTKAGISFTISDVNKADEIEAYITDRKHETVTKHITGDNKTFTFYERDLRGIKAPNNGVIVVTCFRVSYTTFKGKTYKFRLGFKIEKYNITLY